MTTSQASSQPTHEANVIASEQCVLELVYLNAANPTGADILKAAGRRSTPDQLVLQILRKGGLESISLEERADLAAGNKFVLAEGDRTFRFIVDSKQFEWPHQFISGAMLDELAAVPNDRVLRQRHGELLEEIPAEDLIDLSKAGVEEFITGPKERSWKLAVQGVTLHYEQPLVKAGDAMLKAGFDPKKAWHIYLIVQGQPKREIDVDFVIDLRTPGIEKIRLMQRNVDNGDGVQHGARRQFKLLPHDAEYLDGLGLRWEALQEGERQWVLIHDFLLPAGYSQRQVMLALDIPKDYPAAQIDMFYFIPFVLLASGQEIPSTQVRATVDGLTLQGWSRHRNHVQPWDPNSDSIRTHMAVVEGSLAKEVGE